MSTSRHSAASLPTLFPSHFLFAAPSLHPMQPDDEGEESQLARRSLGKGYDSITFADTINTCSRTIACLQSPTQICQESGRKAVNFECSHKPSQLQNCRSSKIRNMKQLLPVELTALLSPTYEAMLKALLKQKKYECMDALSNISSFICSRMGFTVDKNFFGQINCISPLYYQIYQDPLKNLVIRLPKSHHSIIARKKLLRTAMYRFAVSHCEKEQDLASVEEQLPFVSLQPSKTARFFPKNKYSPHVKKQPLLKDQFLASVKQQVLEREAELEKTSSVRTTGWSKLQLSAFVQDIIAIYQSRLVKNLFKANLIDLLANTRKTEDIQAALTLLLSTNALLHQSSQSSPYILSLELQEREKCLQVLEDLSESSV